MARRRKRINKTVLPFTLIVLLILASFGAFPKITSYFESLKTYHNYEIEVPTYSEKKYVILNDNEPYFKLDEYDKESFEEYSELDSLGRAGRATSNIGIDLMPTEERGSIGTVKPTGWHTVKYDFVDGKYLYNRCHLIGYQLTGENANEKNLITCTRSMNADVMLEFENKVAEYIKRTKNHVLYRVTPIYKDKELLARGVEIEAMSVEDEGKEIKFNVFIYNVEDGVEIDYETGESKLENSNGSQES